MEERYTDIRLVKVPLEIDNKNQLTFSSKTAQYNYFNSCTHIELDDSSYQRKDNIVRYPGHIDDLIGYNYCMYKNTQYSDKWYYAYITDMKYISDSMTIIAIKTDVWQTWWSELVFHKSFIEREHVNSDNYGEHTIPENLETGEYITAYSFDSSAIGDSHIVMGTTISPIDGETAVTGGIYGGIYSGCKYYVFQSAGHLDSALNTIATNGNSDSIVSLFYCPDWITGYSTATFTNGIAEVPNTSTVNKSAGILIPLHPTVIDGYTPKNKKLFTYPYVGYLVSNNAGDNITYRLEDFLQTPDESNNYNAELQIWGTCTPGCSIRLIPKYYKVKDSALVEEYNNEYGLTGGKFPIASWSNDTYTNWLTQNAVNIGVGTAGSLVSAGVGAYTGNALGIAGGVLGIANTIGEVYSHSFNSLQASGNINCGDVNYSSGKLTFSGYFMTIKSEYARIIDSFFSMFGYKVNEVKLPNINGRSNWNYIKTIDCNVHGFIPQADLLEIKNMFNAGITFWHNPSTFLDYSQTNSIVS